jgi:uncharacterized membrane protein
MNFFYYLERAWLVAAFFGLGVSIYFFASTMVFNEKVYMPLVSAVFAGLIYYNIHKQRLFLEKRKEETNNNPAQKS